MNKNEILAYLLIGILTFLFVTVGVLFYAEPNFSLPNNIEEEPPDFDPPDRSPSGGSGIALDGLVYVLLAIVIAIAFYFLVSVMRSYFNNRANRKVRGGSKTASMQRRELEDARIRAYEILKKGLETKNYTRAYVTAYIALDKGLEHFRELRRPKHITPKEYAFSVSEPVFQPSVFRIVKIYYNIRYGSAEAMELDLKQFIMSLDNLFIDEVDKETKSDWNKEFERVIRSDYQTYIPRIQDHTKPGGKL